MRQCRLSSIGQVFRAVRVLRERGELERGSDGRIELDFRFISDTTRIPLIGDIACGEPITAIENYEGIYSLPTEFVGRGGENFMLRAKGDSMTGVGINSGDLIIIRQQPSADYGDIVAALIDGEATVKTYRPNKGKIILHPENPEYEDIIVDRDADFRILGIAVGSFHSFI
jgi:repressor LexA